MQVVTGLSKIIDGATELVNGVNPLTTQMDAKNQEIATVLLDAGFTEKDIKRFIDVSMVQFEEWMETEVKVRERIAKMMETKRPSRSKKQTEAA